MCEIETVCGEYDVPGCISDDLYCLFVFFYDLLLLHLLYFVNILIIILALDIKIWW